MREVRETRSVEYHLPLRLMGLPSLSSLVPQASAQSQEMLLFARG